MVDYVVATNNELQADNQGFFDKCGNFVEENSDSLIGAAIGGAIVAGIFLIPKGINAIKNEVAKKEAEKAAADEIKKAQENAVEVQVEKKSLIDMIKDATDEERAAIAALFAPTSKEEKVEKVQAEVVA